MNFRRGDIFLTKTNRGDYCYLLMEKRARINNRGLQDITWMCFTTFPDGDILEVALDEHTLERWFEVETDVFQFHRVV